MIFLKKFLNEFKIVIGDLKFYFNYKYDRVILVFGNIRRVYFRLSYRYNAFSSDGRRPNGMTVVRTFATFFAFSVFRSIVRKPEARVTVRPAGDIRERADFRHRKTFKFFGRRYAGPGSRTIDSNN